MSKGELRDRMPTVTAIIDGFREVFGKDYIDGIIRAGIKGKPVFFASENGHTVGTPVPVGVRVGRDARGNSYLLDGATGGDPAPGKETMREAFYNRAKGK